MPKITKYGGASVWDGNNSSQSGEKQPNLETKTIEDDQQLVQMTENPSEKDQTGNSSASLTDGEKSSDDFDQDEELFGP